MTVKHTPAVRRFRVPEKTVTLRFEESEYEGAEVRVRLNVSLQAFWDFLDLLESDLKAAISLFGERWLAEWNLDYGPEGGELEGQPIPATATGMATCDRDFAIAVLRAWIDAVRNPPAPLGPTSASGSTSGEA